MYLFSFGIQVKNLDLCDYFICVVCLIHLKKYLLKKYPLKKYLIYPLKKYRIPLQKIPNFICVICLIHLKKYLNVCMYLFLFSIEVNFG